MMMTIRKDENNDNNDDDDDDVLSLSFGDFCDVEDDALMMM